MKTPPGFDAWNPAMRGAYRKGHKAAEAGAARETCPYGDVRKKDGRITWSRAFAAAWHDGWTAGDEQRKQDAITAFYTDGAGKGTRPSRWIR